MRYQRADQRHEAVAVDLLVRSLYVVDFTLDPEDVRHAITAPLQLARGVDHGSVEIAAPRPTGDLRAAYGHGSQYDLVERSAIQQRVAELGSIFAAGAVRPQQGRRGDIASPIEEIDNRLSVFRAEPLPRVISSVGLPDRQQHGRTVRLRRAVDSFPLIVRCEASRLINAVAVGSRPARASFRRPKKREAKYLRGERCTLQINTSRSGQESLNKKLAREMCIRTAEDFILGNVMHMTLADAIDPLRSDGLLHPP